MIEAVFPLLVGLEIQKLKARVVTASHKSGQKHVITTTNPVHVLRIAGVDIPVQGVEVRLTKFLSNVVIHTIVYVNARFVLFAYVSKPFRGNQGLLELLDVTTALAIKHPKIFGTHVTDSSISTFGSGAT